MTNKSGEEKKTVHHQHNWCLIRISSLQTNFAQLESLLLAANVFLDLRKESLQDVQTICSSLE